MLLRWGTLPAIRRWARPCRFSPIQRFLGIVGGVGDLDSDWELEVSERSSCRELRDRAGRSWSLRCEACVLFVGLGFVGIWPLSFRPLASGFKV